MTKTYDNDVAFIKALAELLRDNDLTELEVIRDYGQDDSLNVRVARQPVAAPAPAQPAAPAMEQPAAPTAEQPAAPMTEQPAAPTGNAQ